uniref:alginate O-acetyltransferase AlgX-related protein n=1 Tax=uncultured Draconibacterium sp. TaxID=1573823 RepID=UPI00321768FE
MKNQRTKTILFVGFIFVLIFPLLQAKVRIFSEEPLHGDINIASKPEYSPTGWFGGSYQSGMEKFINDNIGFRPFLVRLYNQIQFSLFKQASAKGVVIGEKGYLFEQAYIDAYHGQYFTGRTNLIKKTETLKELQTELENIGKTLIVVLPPGKASYYPEYFPEHSINQTTDSTFYKEYSKLLPAYAVNCFDANDWFLQMKDTVKHILFPQYGIHWSEYGAAIAADSLIKQVERISGRKLPNMIISDIRQQNYSQGTDNDIEWGMNLINSLPSQSLSYPTIDWDYTERDTINMLVVGDSFYWNWYHLGIGEKCFNKTSFWYYNNEVYPDSKQSSVKVKSIDRQSVIYNSDVVLLIASESNLVNMAWGFVNDAINILQDNVEDSAVHKQKIKNVINRIKSDKNWMKSVVEKAKGQNISVDSMLVLDATWVLENE